MEIKNKQKPLVMDLSPYKALIEETKKDLSVALNNSPELCVSTYLIKSKELRDLGKSNDWSSDTEVFGEIKKEFLGTSGIVTEEQLLAFLITVISKKKEKPVVAKSKPKTSKATTKKEPKNMVYDVDEGLFGTEIIYNKNRLTEEEFKEKISEELKEQDFTLEYKNGKVEVVIKVKKESEKKEAKEDEKETKEVETKEDETEEVEEETDEEVEEDIEEEDEDEEDDWGFDE